MPKDLKALLFILLICFCDSKVTISAENLSGLLPNAPQGWIKSEASQTYNRQNLFDYIDGGAEIYLAYDFQKLVVQKYIPKVQDSLQEKSITVEIWQMNSSADAYGIFSLDQEGEKTRIGQIGVYSDGLLRFWKDVFFVSILKPEGDYKDVVLELGNQIDKKIKKEGKLPQLVSMIPSDSLIPGSVCYFHKQITLNNLYNFSDQKVLSLDTETYCALADYRLGNDSLKLLLIQYPDTTISRETERNIKALFLGKELTPGERIYHTKEGKLQGMDLAGKYLILIFEGRDKKNVLWLMNEVRGTIEGSEQRPEPKCFHIH